mgnify:CR=1 FL=1
MQSASPPNTEKRSPFEGFLPFFWLSLACLGGIITADLIEFPTWLWGAAAGLSLGAGILAYTLPKSLKVTHYLRQWIKAEERLPGIILLLFFMVGGWRFSARQPSVTAEHLAYYNDRGAVTLIGEITESPDPRDRVTYLTIEAESITPLFTTQNVPENVNISGSVLVQISPSEQVSYGDRVQFTGQLQTPDENISFSYRDYLAHQGIYSTMPYARVDWVRPGSGNSVRAWIYDLREKGYQTIQDLFPSPEADLLAGILLGRDQGISPSLQEAFRLTGTTHIIAISGFNIAILAGLFSGISTRLLGRKWGAFTSIAAISAYTVMVGADAAVVRAAIMGGLGVFGGMYGRRQNGLNSLGLAVFGMVLINPHLPWDIGFQLSAAATLGLVLFAQPLEERFITLASRWMPEERAHELVGPVSEFFLFTLAAQVMTLPIMAYHFGGISWLALVANPLILPVQSLVMILGGLALLAGMVLPALGGILAMTALPFVRFTIRVVTLLGRLPVGEWVLPDFNVLWLAVFYLFLFFITLLPREKRAAVQRQILSPQFGLIVLSGLVIFVWNRALTLPDGKLHLTLLDSTGTLLVQSPGGNVVLVGGGQSPSQLRQALGNMLPAGDRSIDVVVAASLSRDDLVGLASAVQAADIEMVLWGFDPETNQTSRSVYSLLMEKNVPLQTLEPGSVLELGDGAIIRTLWVGESGAVLWLDWENFSALLPVGDVDREWLRIPAAPDVVLLKDKITPGDYPLAEMNLWSPSVILYPLREADMPLLGEPVLYELLDGYPVITTLEYEWVRVSTDGHQLWVTGE